MISPTEFDCCQPEAKNLSACFPLESRFDPIRSCISFTRSSVACGAEHRHAEQLNAVTSFLDASQVICNHRDVLVVSFAIQGSAKRLGLGCETRGRSRGEFMQPM